MRDDITTDTESKTPAGAPSWRDVLPIHPAAELFPMMSRDELVALGQDICKNGLKTPVTLWSPGYAGDGVKDRPLYVLDGRNRLDAMERAGIQILTDSGKPTDRHGVFDYTSEQWLSIGDAQRIKRGEPVEPSPGTDPYAFVLSANLHRRHLSARAKREVIARVLKAQPEKSNRSIAEQVKADHKTVAAVRERMEDGGEIPHHDLREDARGTKQPAKKKRRTADDFRAGMNARKAAGAIADCVQEVRDLVGQAKKKIPQEDWLGFYCKLADAIDEIFPPEAVEIDALADAEAERARARGVS